MDRARHLLTPANDDVDVQALIAQSHQRSSDFGLCETDRADYSPASPTDLLQALDENRFLFQHAAPVMETLYAQIVNTHSVVLLTTADGLVLHSLGDPDFLAQASRVALVPGVNWSEQSKGTNAIGTALHEMRSLTVRGSQHFLRVNHSLTCSCAPILDPYGRIIGALDVTGDERSSHQHTLALVRMSGQMIENHMFAQTFRDAVTVRFHARPEFLGTLVEGIAVFSHDGRFLSANRSAQFQLGLSLGSLRAHTFSSLFGTSMAKLRELFGVSNPTPHSFSLFNGLSVWCFAKVKPLAFWLHETADPMASAPAGTPPPNQASTEPPTETPTKETPRKPPLSSLRYLDTGDAQMAAVIRKLSMVRDHDIPIMILGETGTGKDLLAQAIHADSKRHAKAFVSVNCAAIPENLIESELFGYEEGAFTGARKKGSVGRIVQAHGGTLFLDEIGDMPKSLQARLLRVLQERKVSPLGAGKEVEVDVAIICATHRNLKELIARGDFREDLYYRLNGLVVRLPALRERSDFEVIIQKIIRSLCPNGESVTLADDVLQAFQRYSWPGNFRQLHNLLRTASVMAGCKGRIERHHLPDDFLDDLENSIGGWASASAAPTAMAGMPCDNGVECATPMPPPNPNADKLQDVTLAAMTQALRQHKGNVSAAAKALGVSRNTIYRKKALLPPDCWG
ncbi:MAG: sigma-54-dependent Fis family transcriptional regulator [Rhodoferax sp.]